MRRFFTVLVLASLVGGLSLSVLPDAAADDKKDTECGEKGQPSCPLQGWMEKNMQPPYDEKDFDKLAVALKKAAAFAPDPKWNKGDKAWKKLAAQGVKAAKAEDFKAVRRTCKSCHKAWRKKYRKEHRMRPIP